MPLCVIFKVNGCYFKHIKPNAKSLKKIKLISACAQIYLPALCIWASYVLYYKTLDGLEVLEFLFESDILKYFNEKRR